MKNVFYFFFAATLLFLFGCKKDSFIEGPDASVSFSADTLHFDTVFTTTGSVTQAFKIFNQNDQKLRLSAVQLAGGTASPFKLNVDGTPGTSFSNIEILPNDSIYVFVSVTINPDAQNAAFIVQDSIMINFNGVNRYVQLDAYGQNAHFLRGKTLTRNETWTNDKPYVILDSFVIAPGAKLTLDSGCRIYSHANAPFLVNGSLYVNGDSTARVSFAGDRLDPDYKDLPGSWPGIFFSSVSTDNVLNYAIIRNAYQGVITEGGLSNKIKLNQCIIDNIFDAGILAYNSSITAVNCLISNCGRNISLNAGGNYVFDFCTAVTIGSFYVQHKSPVLSVSNKDDLGQTYAIDAKFTNSIFYGEGGVSDDEVVANQADLNVKFENCLYKNKTIKADNYFDGSNIKNSDPEFEEIDVNKKIFNFRLKDTSPAINSGNINTTVQIDLDGHPRSDSQPDIGCYERQ